MSTESRNRRSTFLRTIWLSAAVLSLSLACSSKQSKKEPKVSANNERSESSANDTETAESESTDNQPSSSSTAPVANSSPGGSGDAKYKTLARVQFKRKLLSF
jgi:hypothetical protein